MIPPVRTLLRAALGLFTISWWVFPGMGLADLSVSWDADWAVVLEAGWGLLCTFGLGLPLLLAALRPGLARPAEIQLGVVAAALVVAAVGGQEPETWWFFALLAAQLTLLHLLARDAAPPSREAPRRSLLVLAAVAAPAAAAHAWSMLAANRDLHFDADITVGVDHYVVQAAVALAAVALTAAAGAGIRGLGPEGRRLLGTTAAVVAGYLGLVTYCWVDMQGDVGEAWSVLAMAWAAFVLVATWWPVRDARAEAVPVHS